MLYKGSLGHYMYPNILILVVLSYFQFCRMEQGNGGLTFPLNLRKQVFLQYNSGQIFQQSTPDKKCNQSQPFKKVYTPLWHKYYEKDLSSPVNMYDAQEHGRDVVA